MRLLTKRYIIESIYGEICPTCGEFNTKDHLTVFIFHHLNKKIKSIDASKLYHLPCTEIVRILEKERGGYICHNCHTVIHYKRIHLLEQVYDDKNVIEKVYDDYNNVNEKFTIIKDINSIVNPIEKSDYISENLEKYLCAVYELSQTGRDVTTLALRDYLKKKYSWSVIDFFKKNKAIKLFVDVKAGRPYRFILNDRGREAISLIYHFRDYFSSI